jgi:predicted secreted hydrolase
VRAFLKTIAAVFFMIFLPGFMTLPAGGAQGLESWRPASGSRSWSFPADHGAHPGFQTEWWYFTGNVSAGGGRELGYQLTFFRTGLALKAAVPQNRWSVRDLYLAHFAVTDGEQERFYWTERASRAGPGLAGAKEGQLEVWLRDWKAVWPGDAIVLEARSGEMGLDLTLTPRKPPVLHGENGLSVKGPVTGQASWYASITDLETKGTIKIPGEDTLTVSGTSWFDHEFGSNQLAADQQGWDWFSLHLSDGTELMIYQIRRTDGTYEPSSSGTFIAADGSSEHLPGSEIDIQAAGTWRSARSGGTYPSAWTIRIPTREINISVTPVVKDQELSTRATAGITYWEGAVRLEGFTGGKRITGAGYVELTGYAGGLGGIF